MDLLSGYGSSSSDDENDRKGTSAAAAAAAVPAKQQELEAGAAYAAFAATKSDKETDASASSRKGRKILSLASVLPQHILDQLTKSQVQGDQLSDDDDNAGGDDNNASRVKTTTSATTTQLQAQQKGLSSFLSDLHNVAPTGAATSAQPALRQNPPLSTTQASSKKATLSNKRQRMGEAFLQSTTTTATVSSKNAVRDIHAEVVEVQHKTTAAATNTGVIGVTNKLKDPPPPAAATVPPSFVAAAPFLPAVAAPPHPHQEAPRPATDSAYPLPPETTAPPTTSSVDHRSSSRKRSRRELQRALRQGDLSALPDSNNDNEYGQIAMLQQQAPNAHVPAETYAPPLTSHGIRVAPTAMYDPHAGQAVVVGATTTEQTKGGGGRMLRGKNQIHQLMASAAQLELQRARAPTSSSSSSHRANAKTKYGW